MDIPIVSLAGLSILKIISWSNRSVDIRKKDALDLLHLLKTYERVPAVSQAVFDAEGLMESYDWDTTLAAAHLLGIDASKINSVATRTHFVRLQAGEIIPQGMEQLVTEMADDDDHHERNRSLLEAYFTGMVHANR